MRCNEIAAEIHYRMVTDPRFGYSWGERWGYYWNVWTIGLRDYIVFAGDYDCSSSCITAWKKALEGTAYEGVLDGATYTGNMRSVFVGSGLFEWKPMSFIAEPGDLYLNEGSHVAMCQSQEPDLMSEFCINEFGDVYGGERGDQTGWESAVNPYRDFADGILHYNGKADTGESSGGSSDGYPHIANPQWQGEVVGLSDTTNAGDDYAGVFGHPMLYVAIEGVGTYQVHDNAGWWPKVRKYDLDDEEDGMAGNGNAIDAVRIDDSTVCYQTHNLGGDWNDVMKGLKDTGGSSDDYAGEYGVAQDAIRIWRESGTQPRYNVFS